MRLLYYNPGIVAHERNRNRADIDRFGKFFQIFNSSVVIVDRTNSIKIPVQVKSLFPMPALQPINKTFEEICNQRARDLLKRSDDLKAPIYVFWSGGIDSTLLLVTFLKNSTDEQVRRITVLMSEESISENPTFYKEHILGKLHMDSSLNFPHVLGGSGIIVGGEHNDQLFGSDMMGQLIVRFGPNIINERRNSDKLILFFTEKTNDPRAGRFYLELFDRLAARSPVAIETHHDYFWWINFSLKWQSVFMRMLAYTSERTVANITADYITTNYFHFYGKEDFQLWSMNNMDKKIKDTWNTYKWVCKDIIYDYTRDADYRDNKTKRGSLFHLLTQRSRYEFIDESMQFHRGLDFTEYYNPDNDFI